MTIEIAASRKALCNSEQFDFDDPAQFPDFYVTAILGFDLTGLGAHKLEVPGEYGPEIAVNSLNFPLLLASVNAAFQGGIDFVQLKRNFQAYEESSRNAHRHCTILSAVKTVEKISELINNGGFNIEFPLDSENALPAVDGFLANYDGQKAISVALKTAQDLAVLEEFSQVAKRNELQLVVLSDDLQFLQENAQKIACLVDVVQIQSAEMEKIRALRFLFQKFAKTTGHEVKIIVELGIVISATLQSAQERAALIADLASEPLFTGIAKAVGTVYDVADCVEKLIGNGVADGIFFVPASLPTDLASVLKGVIPLLRERAKSGNLLSDSNSYS